MNIEELNIFPFEFTELPLQNNNKLKKPFIQNVETILTTDLQTPDSFGCKIHDSHTHAGSKVHFKDFIEAELLFHNSYYNHGFAILTVEEIEKKLENRTKVLLVGYENYSELYLQEVCRLFKEIHQEETFSCNYCVYETTAQDKMGERITLSRIRNLYKPNKESDSLLCLNYGYSTRDNFNTVFSEDDFRQTLLVFIVPINTTLSTMDKMISKFKEYLQNGIEINNPLLLCLITIGNGLKRNNYYWKLSGDMLNPIHKRFVNIEDNCIKTFAYVNSKWMYNNITAANFQRRIENSTKDHLNEYFCTDCFPDIVFSDKTSSQSEKLLDEKPIFDVTRGSVVPMLQLNRTRYLQPVQSLLTNKINNFCNLSRVWKISKHMTYRHIMRDDNHFQYYFDAIGFLNDHTNKVLLDATTFLDNIKTVENNNYQEKNAPVIYNYIVAPRQKTNVKWVDLVCNRVFSCTSPDKYNPDFDGARILYFDITKEYRSNIKAKYSDFYRMINNIKKSGQKSEIRFHYVDETISTGKNFMRAADLIRSLIGEIPSSDNQNFRISLFHSVFLLYGRSSRDTKNFYMNLFDSINLDRKTKEELYKHLYEYVHISISSMRHHEDACTLCKLATDYRKIQKDCATNRLADISTQVIEKHKTYHFEEVDDQQFKCSTEKQLVFFITHLLNERLGYNNSPIFPAEKEKSQIDIASSEGSSKIKAVLDDYYENSFSWLTRADNDETHKPIIDDVIEKVVFQNAFIKSISRPFFTFDLRKRQASFAFCLEKLNTFLKEKNITESNLILVQSLVKALADMNANYLIRNPKDFSPFYNLLEWAEYGDQNSKIVDSEKHTRKLFTSENLIHYIKKMMSLTQDTTKSLLLEHSLVYGVEDGFFKKIPISSTLEPITSKFLNRNSISPIGWLYLENNCILNYALKDIRNNTFPDIDKKLYFFDNFNSICKINKTKLDDNFFITYNELIKSIESFEGKTSEIIGLDKKINNWFQKITGNQKLRVVSFVRDVDNNGFISKYFAYDEDTSEKRKKDLYSFYIDENQHNIQLAMNDHFEYDTIYLGNINSKNERNLIIKINGTTETNKDKSLYFQIFNFNSNNIKHWLALKMFLTLRRKFSEKIDKSNMSEVIQNRRNKLLTKALGMKKASSHAGLVENLMSNFSKPGTSPMLLGVIEEMTEPLASQQLFIKIYDKYLSVLANETISMLYRLVIRDKHKNPYKDHSSKVSTEETWPTIIRTPFCVPELTWCGEYGFRDSILNGLNGHFLLDSKKLSGEFDFWIPGEYDGKFKSIRVKVSQNSQNEEIWCKKQLKFLQISGGSELQNLFYLVLVLLILNVNQHEKTREVQLIFDAQNNCVRINNATNMKKTSKVELEERLHINPVIRAMFNDERGLTLWVLKQIFGDNLSISYIKDPTNSRSLFQVEFKIIEDID